MQRVGRTYARVLLGLIITDFLLTFIIPSGIARVVVMSAIALGLVEAFGVGPAAISPRDVPHHHLRGRPLRQDDHRRRGVDYRARGDRTRRGVEVLWSRWFLAYLPCDIITILIAWRLTLWLYPPEKESFTRDEAAYLEREIHRMGSWNAASTRRPC